MENVSLIDNLVSQISQNWGGGGGGEVLITFLAFFPFSGGL